MNLYQLNSNYRELQEKLYDEDYDVETVIDTLDSIEEAIESKAHNYAIIINEFDGDIEKIDKEIKRLQARKKVLDNRKTALKSRLFDTMKTVGLTKITTPLFNVTIQKNGGKRALVMDCDLQSLPEQFRIVKEEINNTALREYLGDSESCEYCHLAEQGESLRIR